MIMRHAGSSPGRHFPGELGHDHDRIKPGSRAATNAALRLLTAHQLDASDPALAVEPDESELEITTEVDTEPTSTESPVGSAYGTVA